MEKIRYKKINYLDGKYKFFLYVPIQLDITHEEYNQNGEAKKIMYISAGDIYSYPVCGNSYTVVKDFVPDEKNKFLTDYQDVFVACINDNASYYPKTLHTKCRVLTEKHGGYTQLQCESCGEISLIAINSWKIATEKDLKQNKCNETY